jgi:hypothetical protein
LAVFLLLLGMLLAVLDSLGGRLKLSRWFKFVGWFEAILLPRLGVVAWTDGVLVIGVNDAGIECLLF